MKVSPPNEVKPFKPTIRGEISLIDLLYHLKSKFPEAPIYLSREIYNLCNLEDIEEFLRLDDTDSKKYNDRAYRCGDFTYRIKGQLAVEGWSDLAHGIFWSDKHAMLFFVDQNLDCWYIEPQNDRIEDKLADWQGTTCRFVMM